MSLDRPLSPPRVVAVTPPGFDPLGSVPDGPTAADPVYGAAGGAAPECDAALELRGGALAYGPRTLWSGLDLAVQPGEFLAVLGPNGSGKTSLLRVLLGLTPLTAGRLEVGGRPARRGSATIGYVPQQQGLSGAAAAIRARDLVRLGVDGLRWGVRLDRGAGARVDEVLAAVGALDYADAPLGMLSGGEQQRVRIAQALVSDPSVLVCDEPLLSLDLQHQQAIVGLLDARRRSHGTAVVLVTHEINPIMGVVDRVLFLGPRGHRLGLPSQILTSPVLTELYGTPVQVLNTEHGVAILTANAGRV